MLVSNWIELSVGFQQFPTPVICCIKWRDVSPLLKRVTGDITCVHTTIVTTASTHIGRSSIIKIAKAAHRLYIMLLTRNCSAEGTWRCSLTMPYVSDFLWEGTVAVLNYLGPGVCNMYHLLVHLKLYLLTTLCIFVLCIIFTIGASRIYLWSGMVLRLHIICVWF
jgi:hypothetical protein